MYLSAHGLGVRLGGHWIFRAVDFVLGPHDRWVVVGPSGQGKSTLLRCLAGVMTPTGGRVMMAPKRTCGWMAQSDLLLPWKTVRQNVRLNRALAVRAPDEEQVEEALVALGLEEQGEFFPGQLSQGMRQRVALARTLLQGSDIVLLDEPCAALDLATRERALHWILEEQKRRGFGLMMVTHQEEDRHMVHARVMRLNQESVREEALS